MQNDDYQHLTTGIVEGKVSPYTHQ